MSPRFSVVISSYNYGSFIAEAVDSVLAQSVPALEIVIVDDGSTDGTPALLAERYAHDARLRVIVQPNAGQLSAFVTGVAAACGDVIGFLDADDRWEPDHLERLARAYADPARFDAVHTNLRCFGQRDGLWHDNTADRDLGLTALQAWYFQHWLGSPTSALSMRRTLALRILDLPRSFQPDWRTRADDVLVLGAGILGAHQAYLGHASVGYRVHGENHWLGRASTRAQDLQHQYRLARLVAHFAAISGLRDESLRLLRREFQTQPAPDAETFRRYRRMAWRAPLPFGKRCELVVGMLRHYRQCRRNAS